MASSSPGTSSRSRRTGTGVSWRMAALVAAGDSRRNATCPVSSSYSIAPKLKTSEGASTAPPVICSGDMYGTVPITGRARSPCCSCEAASRANDSGPAGPGRFTRVAMPKSSTLTGPSGVTITFDGFRSRWITPRRCATATASAISTAIFNAWSSGGRPSHIRSASVRPGTSSITRNLVPSTSPTSCSAQMCGWFRPATVLASSRKSARRPGSASAPTGRILIATSRSRRVSRPRKTCPMPPSPISESTS